jgi:hypothetical protein
MIIIRLRVKEVKLYRTSKHEAHPYVIFYKNFRVVYRPLVRGPLHRWILRATDSHESVLSLARTRCSRGSTSPCASASPLVELATACASCRQAWSQRSSSRSCQRRHLLAQPRHRRHRHHPAAWSDPTNQLMVRKPRTLVPLHEVRGKEAMKVKRRFAFVLLQQAYRPTRRRKPATPPAKVKEP